VSPWCLLLHSKPEKANVQKLRIQRRKNYGGKNS
jgi:hypothetical protein